MVSAAILAATLTGTSVAVALPLSVFRDGPPAAVTGGFGEDSCHACHWGDEPNDREGTLSITGLPRRFEAGRTYALGVTLTRPGMRVGGFQLAARFAHTGEQAGALNPGDGEGERVSVLTAGGIEYIQHLLGGIPRVAPDTARWTVEWTAPPEPGDRVIFHAAGVAGDDDESQIGDRVYTVEAVTRPRGHRPR